MNFVRGLKDGLPIALGYMPVAFAYAIRAISQGFPAWFPILISATNFTGTGQVAGRQPERLFHNRGELRNLLRINRCHLRQ